MSSWPRACYGYGMRTATLLAALTLVASGCDEDEAPAEPSEPSETPEAPEPHAAIDIDDPSACASCHAEVVREWRGSMHASAHHEADPIYGAMRTLRMGREGAELATKCASCHGPRDPENPDSEVAGQGVACASCHALDGVNRGDGGQRRGAKALQWSADDRLRGPHDVSSEAAPHPVGEAAPWLTDGETLCLACHGELANAQGAPTCTTGTEHEAATGDGTCTGCHMPEVDGASGAVSTRSTHRSHAFLGPHTLWADEPDPAFMASAVELRGTLAGDALEVTVANRTQHAMPSGFPGRMVLVKVRGLDAEGEVAWQNFTDAPMREDPDAVLNKVYHDAEGEVVLPPYGVELVRDTRLRPDESRTLRWTVPDDVERVEVALIYRLLPPPAVEALQLGGRPEAGARPFATLSVTRSE
jgi:hypothetical protein